MRKSCLLVLALLAACGDSDNGTDPLPLVVTTAFELQSGGVAVGRDVEVTAYIVAISTSGSRVWIADAPAAAAWSGLEVFRGNNPPALGASVGDRVTVTGRLQEFGAGSGLTVTQIASPDFELVSPAAGAPVPVAGLDLATITQDPVPGIVPNGEAYEGVLVELQDIEVTATAPTTYTDGTTAFGASDIALPLTDAVGTCYATVRGIWNYDVQSDEWIIVPVAGGLVAGGTCS
jgi:hypothetical protein